MIDKYENYVHSDTLLTFFFGLTIATILGTWMHHYETMCCIHSWSQLDVDLWPQGQIYRVFDMFSCPVHNYLLIWHWLTIFGICVNHHEKMCRVHSWSRFYLELWPKCQIYGFFSCLCVRPIISVCFDIGIPYLAHMSITMRTCVAFIHDPDRKWPLTSGPIDRVYNMVLCLGHSFFVLWQSHIMHVSLTPWYNVLRTFITSIWPWHLTSISKFEFSPRT